MHPRFTEVPNATDASKFSVDNYDHASAHTKNGVNHDFLDLDVLDIPFLPLSPGPDNFAPSSNYEADSPDDQDSDPVFKFLNQILIEENLEEKPSMFLDPLALRAAEKSFYEVIGQEYPPSPYQTSDSPSSSSGASTELTNSTKSRTSSADPQWIVDPGDCNPSSDMFLQIASQSSSPTVNNFNIQANPYENTTLLQNMFRDDESILQFKRGMEEASKFLPPSNQLAIDLDKFELPKKSEDITTDVVVNAEKNKNDLVPNGLTGRKHHHLDDGHLEDIERSSKQSAVYVEDVELSDMFDRVLLLNDSKELCFGPDATADTSSVQNLVPNGSNGGRNHSRRNENESEAVDLRNLLISCAQSVASDDRRTAYEQLKQIRQHSSPTGDAYQRLANVFASGLEARLGATGNQLYTSLARRKITAFEKLKAYQVFISASPFKKFSIMFANKMIWIAASEATTLHVVDFGILYGFQWPILIQLLSQRPGGPPKLRITGIELPQPGFRPGERIEETGIRLAKYCKRFGVPFEYQAIARRNWEAIKIEDLNIKSGEVLAVNNLFRLGRLLDETVVADSPRDAVLDLIRKMKPDIVVNAVDNGSYSAPFFVTRFREALFHYSALFDMFDATLPRDNPERMIFEQDFYGREVINVVACEGEERVNRPETYKQWQARYARAGFKPMPLNPELMKKLRHKIMAGYHRDFLFDEDGKWMLQGWKGRIMCASSCWVPAKKKFFRFSRKNS